MLRRRVGLALLACAAIGFGGCGSSDDSSSGEQQQAPAATPEESGGSAASSGGTAAKEAEATIKDFTFKPETVTVSAGGSVSWTNEDAANHNVVFDDKSVEGIGNLRTDQDGKVTFDKAGTYAYVCTYHPGMKGTVVVK